MFIAIASGRAPVAVITCERQAPAFSLTELQQMRLTATWRRRGWLSCETRTVGLGRDGLPNFARKAPGFIGPEHTWAKLLALLIMVLLVLLVLCLPYRVQGNFILRSGQAAYLSAPFEGYIGRYSGASGRFGKGGPTASAA